MSKSTKIVIAVIVIILVLGGIWWYVSMKNGGGAVSPSGSQSNAAQTSGNAETPVLSQSTSDASLNADLSAIDGQLNGLASDSASADQSLSSSTGQ